MDTDTDDNDENAVNSYLRRVLAAARTLATESMQLDCDADDDSHQQDTESAENLLDSLAQTLLQIGSTLHYESLEGLPPPPEPIQDDWDPLDADLKDRAYHYRRTDYLRRLLRALAPVAMELAARIMEDNSLASFVVLAFWMPIAPQLMHGVADYFESGNCPFPFDQEVVNEQELPLLLEAAHHVAHEFWYTHRQPLRTSWTWSRVARYQEQYPWFARRILSHVLEMFHHTFLEKNNADFPFPQGFVLHPWDLHIEAMEYQTLLAEGHTKVFWSDEPPFPAPQPDQVYRVLRRPHDRLCHLHHGYVFWKQTFASAPTNQQLQQPLVMTPTTDRNLQELAEAMCAHERPILLLGGTGSSLVRHAARTVGAPLLDVYLDETTDAATLLGTTVVSTDADQQFKWQPGAITKAATAGHWVLLHSLDTVMDLQAMLEPLFQDGLLTRHQQRAHRNFRCFAVVQQASKILHPRHFVPLSLHPVPKEEIAQVVEELYPQLPRSILEATVQLGHHESTSVRQFLKLAKRLAQAVRSTTNDYITERDRLVCISEAVDCLVQHWSDPHARQVWIQTVAAPAFGVAPPLAWQFVSQRGTLARCVRDGAGALTLTDADDNNSTFVNNPTSVRLLDSLAVAVQHNEPVLLVGESGTGKTTVIQQLARLMADTELVVQNVSLQTDATDLLGGYRPLELRQVARQVYQQFVDVFTGTFSRQQNAEFLQFTATAYQNGDWKKLSSCFRRAAGLGMKRVQDRGGGEMMDEWATFSKVANRFEQQRTSSGPLFGFTEGALVDAIRTGKWVLLDEINLASSETLQRLTGLLGNSSLTLTERGDSVALQRHPSFRLFAAMNPSTDAGKKELASGIRSKFTELFVDELLNSDELQEVVGRYLSAVVPIHDSNHTMQLVVKLYLKFRKLANQSLVDGSGQRPRYTLRTLTRAARATSRLVSEQKYPLHRALYESFQLAFQGPLDSRSFGEFDKVLKKELAKNFTVSQLDHPGRRPGGRQGEDNYHLIKPFWIQSGPLPPVDWAQDEESNRFVLVPSTRLNLRRLARSIASGPWPVLLEGPTSAGKTTLVEYVAARCGHTVVRINNHEHTDVQEYTGCYTADGNGSLVFQDGILVTALRKGHWVILDELNLAPSDVLEALNRLLDDNRELYIPETNETVHPHTNFRLFATQNPSGSYGGRKPLSRAFRNRFVEMQVNDIPSDEMATILEKRCGCPPSHAKLLIDVMISLRQKRSRSGVFLGDSGFITPRDLLRWAGRGATTKKELAREGYMLLAERLRTEEEKNCVEEEIGRIFKLNLDLEDLYYGKDAIAQNIINQISVHKEELNLSQIAPTKSLVRVLTLVQRCLTNREPVLLVGETGCGKTMAVQLLCSIGNSKLNILNCHQTTETSDLIGGLRPVRGRSSCRKRLVELLSELKARAPSLLEIPTMDLDCVSDELLASVAKKLKGSRDEFLSMCSGNNGPNKKCRRVTSPSTSLLQKLTPDSLLDEYDSNYTTYVALFEWEDGPLIKAMKRGESFLLDEMSLAEDAVLERLNSVLEHSRTIVLAEKSSFVDESRSVSAKPSFQLFATMNPGGDYGKRELTPALRSRFTEIWVPAVNDPGDIRLVLEKSLSQSRYLSESNKIVGRMMEYVDWFNSTASLQSASGVNAVSLSMRDILSWSSFVVENVKTGTLNLWDAYIHGAHLMHLDGLGLGSGMSREQASHLLNSAEKVLENQVNDEVRESTNRQNNRIALTSNSLQMGPFTISSGPKMVDLDVPFFFDAPTTSNNLERIFRALQLPKPILLEGNPGCGKTSLIGSLASIAGHDLVRINLSEQTDMADLLGGDVPVNEGSSSTVFKWVDGALLSAIKSGSWVLLDELNLASQCVLEGLNSCLDHRAEVYIPELGSTFICPSSFRVFAAQNSLLQGGGRKGLPKSFLNRFTKVYVDSLCDVDFELILHSRFPDLKNVGSVVEFNRMIHNETTNEMILGRQGAPFEFNLRDIFRWAQLSSKLTFSSQKDRSMIEPASLLYLQRFRGRPDRERALSIFRDVFGLMPTCLRDHTMSSSGNSLTIGKVDLLRHGERSSCRNADLFPTTSSFESLVSAARCVEMNWPVLLIGEHEANPFDLPRYLSSLLDSRLTEVQLFSSTDVSELIGSFEQNEHATEIRLISDNLIKEAQCLLQTCSNQRQEEMISVAMEKFLAAKDTNDVRDGVGQALSLIAALSDASPCFHETTGRTLRRSFESVLQLDISKAAFAWRDGPLVEAMKTGGWLHLRNVNLCASAVLDRLNPVMEPGGTLLLTEAGSDGSGEHREIQCHPDFRIFLSMDPRLGEVSRAMRNRCVELYVLSDEHNEDIEVDKMSACSRWNVRLQDFDWKMGLFCMSGHFSSKIVASSVLEVIGRTSQRGISPTARITSRDLTVVKDASQDGRCFPRSLANCGWGATPLFSALSDKCRILLFMEALRQQDFVTPLHLLSPSKVTMLTEVDSVSVRDFRNHLLTLCVFGMSRSERTGLLDFISSKQNSTKASIECLYSILQDEDPSSQDGRVESMGIELRHAAWDLRRAASEDRLQSTDSYHLTTERPKSILQASYFFSKGFADPSSDLALESVLTPFIYPILRDFSNLAKHVQKVQIPGLHSALKSFREELMSLWMLVDTSDVKAAAERSALAIQWRLCHQSFSDLYATLERLSVTITEVDVEQLHNLTSISEQALSGLAAVTTRPVISLEGRLPKPLVPRTAAGWITSQHLRSLGRTFCVDRQLHCQRPWGLENITKREETGLFAPIQIKREIMCALSSLQLLAAGHLLGSLDQVLTDIPAQIERRVKRFRDNLHSEARLYFYDQSSIEDAVRLDMHAQKGINGVNSVAADFITWRANALGRMAQLQTAACAESLCEQKEREILSFICNFLMNDGKDLVSHLRSCISDFIEVCLLDAQWSVSDIYPYKTILWLLDESVVDAKVVLRSLVPILQCGIAKRNWVNVRDLHVSVSNRLCLPFFPDSQDEASKAEKKNVSSNVVASTAFSVVGIDQLRAFSNLPDLVMTSLENYETRCLQKRRLFSVLSKFRLPDTAEAFVELRYSVAEILSAVAEKRSVSDCIEGKPMSCVDVKTVTEDFVGTNCQGSFDDETKTLLVLPLIRLIHEFNSTSTTKRWLESNAKANVMLGVLQLHCRTPDPGEDPGLRPLGAIFLAERRINFLTSELAALEVHQAFNAQNCKLNGQRVDEIARECRALKTEQLISEGQVILRPAQSPPFLELHERISSFVKSHLSATDVVSMLEELTGTEGTQSWAAVRHATNWKKTAESFCDYLYRDYETYEDIVAPIVAAVGRIIHGMTLLIGGTADESRISHLSRALTDFPLRSVMEGYAAFSSIDDLSELSVEATNSLGLSALRSALMRKFVVGFDKKTLVAWRNSVCRLMDQKSVDFLLTMESSHSELEFEEDLKAQFPTYQGYFSSGDDPQDDNSTPARSETRQKREHSISFTERLFALHYSMFAEQRKSPTDDDRMLLFRTNYTAARQLHLADNQPIFAFDTAVSSGHGFALAMGARTPSLPSAGCEIHDFHKDPSPGLAVEASLPLTVLFARCMELLSMFPDNEILLSVAKVTDKVMKLDLYNAPIGKFITGLEVILKHAQDWELHSSKQFYFGGTLTTIRRLAATWRKLEMNSWPNLVRGREYKAAKEGSTHWGKLQNIFYQLQYDALASQEDLVPVTAVPSWIWIGFKLEHAELTPSNSEVKNVVETIDLFCRTASVGGVESRLEVLKGFACQLEMEIEVDGCKPIHLSLLRSLKSIVQYYKQFDAYLSDIRSKFRLPVVDQLKRATKLAKWDDQTDYAALDANERNHRKVMNILREYDDSLRRNVSALLEEEICRGVRPNLSTKGEVISKTPPCRSMFPILPTSEDKEDGFGTPIWQPNPESGHFTDYEAPLRDGYPRLCAPNLRKYAQKIAKLRVKKGVTSDAERGRELSQEFRETIFARLEALRSPKSSRPMKERALTDLLKKLKSEGFYTTALNLPSELNRPLSLFEAPSPDYLYIDPTTNTEFYFQRCFAETISFQIEIDTIGSDFMTKSQLEIMSNVSKHGLLMLIQQRSVLHSAVTHLRQQTGLCDELLASSKPCAGQSKLQSGLASFREDILLAQESLKQLFLYLQTCEAMVDDASTTGFVGPLMAKIESLIGTLNCDAYKRLSPNAVVCESDVAAVSQSRMALDHIKETLGIASHQNSTLQILPLSSFTNCVRFFEKAALSCGRFLDMAATDYTKACSEHSAECFLSEASKTVEATLLTVQRLIQDRNEGEQSLLELHRSATMSFVSSRMDCVSDAFLNLRNQLCVLYDGAVQDEGNYGLVAGDVAKLLLLSTELAGKKTEEYHSFHREFLKLQYVLVRVFRVLASTGFCGAEESESSNKDTSKMSFEDDVDGTGMGEGEGKQDVTDEIENEEQLVGLRQEDDDETAPSKENESKQLSEEEAETGMEMENNFDGEMYDIPEKEPERDEDSGEEVEQEMGDGPDASEQVVDEKLWDESDEETEEDDAEGIEEGNEVKGKGTTEEMTTKDSTPEDEQGMAREENTDQKDENIEDPGENPQDCDEDKINEEKFEESNGVDVRMGDPIDDGETEEDEDQMELDDNMSMNEDDVSSEKEETEEQRDEADSFDFPPPGDEEPQDDQDESEQIDASTTENGEPQQDIEVDDAKEEKSSVLDPAVSQESYVGLGVTDDAGNDAVDGTGAGGEIADTEDNAENNMMQGPQSEDPATRNSETEITNNGGTEGKHGQHATSKDHEDRSQQSSGNAPNPLTDPEGATEFWRRKSHIVDTEEQDASPAEDSENQPIETEGEFELAGDSKLVAVGDTEQSRNLDNLETNQSKPQAERDMTELEDDREATRSQHTSGKNNEKVDSMEIIDEKEEFEEDSDDTCPNLNVTADTTSTGDAESGHERANVVMTDTEALQLCDEVTTTNTITGLEETGVSSSVEELKAREQWGVIMNETFTLARRLCESLRLVIEPLVASKLRGDYRTGKRINMKRVISYVASGYRKDKIWLRRTKPAKRNYRVLLAVDDSQSMSKSGADKVALRAMSTLATAMSQLEIGEIGIASFGNEMKVVHGFENAFTTSSGASVIRNFRFDQQRTRTALCIESALVAMKENVGDCGSMQLFFMISDGRIERDSRVEIRRLVREMVEQNILLVLIIVEGSEKNSVANMKEVSFENGKPVVKRFMDDYPFPYYIIVNDMQSLPEVLADSLRQWFEMLSRLRDSG